MKTISDADLREILEVNVETRSGQYICRCPYCGKEEHFYINKVTQQWDCKKCGEFGNIGKLLRYLGKTYLLDGATIENTDVIKSIRDMATDVAEEKTELEVLPEKKMPAGWKVLSKSNPYLLSRRITPELCERYQFGETKIVGKYKNYVLIPIYDRKRIRGFVGRYGNKVVPENKKRYNNSLMTKFAQLLYGYDEINSATKAVVLVEGIFDKIAVDQTLNLWDADEMKCVCTFGKKISEQQIEKLRRKNIAVVILLYDFDALKDIKKVGLKLENDFVTYIVYTTKKDIDECSRKEALAVFQRMYKPREFNENVIGKLKR